MKCPIARLTNFSDKTLARDRHCCQIPFCFFVFICSLKSPDRQEYLITGQFVSNDKMLVRIFLRCTAKVGCPMCQAPEIVNIPRFAFPVHSTEYFVPANIVQNRYPEMNLLHFFQRSLRFINQENSLLFEALLVQRRNLPAHNSIRHVR